jgi:hypothetical protein
MRPFEIEFDFPVASSDLKISLNATAELHHSEPYYLVHNFYLTNGKKNTKSPFSITRTADKAHKTKWIACLGTQGF